MKRLKRAVLSLLNGVRYYYARTRDKLEEMYEPAHYGETLGQAVLAFVAMICAISAACFFLALVASGRGA